MKGLNLLDGLKIIEIAEGIAGPMAGKTLIDLGATVTRIESPDGDWLRKLAGEKEGDGVVYRQLNANKRVLTLDLTQSDDQEKLRSLVADADIAIVGQRRAKLDKLGLTYESLREITPRLIYCHVSGWGSEGPQGDRAASELTVQAAAGMMRYLGESESDPVRQGFDLVSVNTGLAAAQAALAAYVWREQSGNGQQIEVSMLSTAIALQQWNTAAESRPDRWEGRQLAAQQWPSDHGFQCADTRCLIDMRGNELGWASLLRDLDYPELADDPRFSTREGLDLHVTELPALTAGKMASWAFEDLEKLVRDKYEGTIVPVLNLTQVVNHPQVKHIGMITDEAAPRVLFPMEVK